MTQALQLKKDNAFNPPYRAPLPGSGPDHTVIWAPLRRRCAGDAAWVCLRACVLQAVHRKWCATPLGSPLKSVVRHLPRVCVL